MPPRTEGQHETWLGIMRGEQALARVSGSPAGFVPATGPAQLSSQSVDQDRGVLRAVNQLLAASPASPESAASVVTRLDQAGLIREDDGLGPVAEAEFGE
jgi:hypothetical protein